MAVEIERQELDRVIDGIALTDDARYIAVVTCNSPAARMDLVVYLRRGLGRHNIGLDVIEFADPRAGLASKIDRRIRQESFRALEDRYASIAIAVIWAESVIPEEELRDDSRVPSALQKLNLGREYFVEFPHPLVLVVPDYIHERIARQAPDFYRIRTDAIDVETGFEPALAISEPLLRAEEWQAQSSEDARDRIEKYREAIGKLAGREDGRSRELRARLLYRLGKVHSRAGRYEDALNSYEAALFILRDLGELHGEAEVLNNIAVIHSNRGEYDQAMRLLLESLKAYRELADRHGECAVLHNMGTVHQEQGLEGRAMELYADALAICDEIGDRRGRSQVLNNTAALLGLQGRHEEALEMLEESLTVDREIGDQLSEASTLVNMANTLGEEGRHARAMALYDRALSILRELNDPRGLAIALMNSGSLALHVGDSATANARLREALSAIHGMGIPEEDKVRELLAQLDEEPSPAEEDSSPDM